MTDKTVTQADIHAAALQWCGEKERETSCDDIRYFESNWKALPGLRERVEKVAAARQTDAQMAAPDDERRVEHIAHILEKWDMTPPPNDFTGHDYKDIARDIIASLSASNVMRDALEAAAKICEEQQQIFASPQYATGQPFSSFGERFACGKCAGEIRQLKDTNHD